MQKMESPGAANAGAQRQTGVVIFQMQEYPGQGNAATAYRIAHLIRRVNVSPARAATLADLVFGEGAQ